MANQFRPETDQPETGRQETQKADLELRLKRLEKPSLKKGEVAPATDKQIKAAIPELSKNRALSPERWKGLNEGQRVEVARNIEKQMAKIQNRPSVEVRAEKMGPGIAGGYDGTRIRISQELVRSNNPQELLHTMVHEGRHAYQRHAATHPGFHPNKAEVDAWKENMKNYKDPRIHGMEAYKKQPIEADAWNYERKIAPKVMEALR